MAGFKATNKVSCWKQHQCSACSSLYRYQFERSLEGSGRTAEAAQEALAKTVQKSLETEVDFQPCPQCGTYQPDMTAQRQRSRLVWIWGATPTVGFIMICLGYFGGVRPDQMLWAVTIFGALMAAAIYFLESRNPNADLRANLLTAQKAITAGKLALDESKSGYEPGRAPTGLGMSVPFMAMLGIGVALLPAAELFRGLRGWPSNPELHFPVVGPGDSARLDMLGKVQSVKGLWAADASVQVLNPNALPPGAARQFTVSSLKQTWGGSISVKSSQKNSGSTPFADLKVPTEASLAGKSVDLLVKLKTTYPKMMVSGSSFMTENTPFERKVTVKLADPGAGSTYKSLWVSLLSIGVLLITAVGFLAWRGEAAASRNTQTKLLPIA